MKVRKLTALVLAVVCAMALGMTAFAAGSPSASGVAGKVTSAVDENGNPVEVTVTETSQAAPSAAELKELLGDDFVEGMKVVDVMDVHSDVTPVTITFSVPGVTADSNVAVLHYNGSAWEVVDSKAGNASVTATFKSLSPVAIVADTAEAGTGAASPKTGEPATVAVVGGIALLAAAAAFGLKKRAF